MALSLSSLLNPSPDADSRPSPPPQTSAEKESVSALPSILRPKTQQFTYPSAPPDEAAHALASLSNTPAPPPTQWYGYSPTSQQQPERQRSGEWRPGSSYGDTALQLPPPPSPADGAARKLSSPTLEQYHVASRSPEQRRASLLSPAQSDLTLPPLQRYIPPVELPRQPSHAREAHVHQVNAPPQYDVSSTQSTRLQKQESGDRQLSSSIHPTSPPAPAKPETTMSDMAAQQGTETASSPSDIKQETIMTPQLNSPTEAGRPADPEHQSVRAVASLKNEHGLRTHSPLRDSSVPIPSTEDPTAEPKPSNPRKRPASSKKKGTATSTKKAPASKKRKVETTRDTTPSSRASKPPLLKSASSKGTPANSSPAPSTRSHTVEPNDEQYDDEDGEEMDEDGDGDVYCLCRKPDSGTFMIGCDGTCDDWFHGKCVGIEEKDKSLIDKYMCPECTKAGIGQTTWKRICRRQGCRQPAKGGKGKSASKYCSDECGVLFFRDMVSQSRGWEEAAKSRSTRRKGSTTGGGQLPADDDLGAKGGVLAAGEVKALLSASKNVEDFKKLGDGVLSPPATPNGEHKEKSSNFTDAETQAVQQIQTKKEDARRRHGLLKDRLKFVNMVKQAASRMVTEKELKPKDYCGYDSRLEWTEDEFQTWRDSKSGQQALELDTLDTEKSNAKDVVDVDMDEDTEFEVCDASGKKKCNRHLEWAKLAVDDLRMEMSENGDRMRGLDREEKEIRERAALRAKAGCLVGEGTVELHGLGVSAGEPAVEEEMDIDVTPSKLEGEFDHPMGEAAEAGTEVET